MSVRGGEHDSAYQSPERFAVHYQYTDTPVGTFFCSTHIEAGRDPAHAVTLGVSFDNANSFPRARHRKPARPLPVRIRCVVRSWHLIWRSNGTATFGFPRVLSSAILGLIAADPYPDLDMADIVDLVDSHAD